MFDLNRHLKSEHVFIFGCAETFSTSDEKPYNLDNDYQWVGKSTYFLAQQNLAL
jgi:hypothetical protein